MSVLLKQFRIFNLCCRKEVNKLSGLLSSSSASQSFQGQVQVTRAKHYHQHQGRPSSWGNMPNSSHHRHPRVITISVDGNISSGKSTLVSNLEKVFPDDFRFQVELVPEPLEKWTDLRGHNLLGMFYDDPVKHNFMFQHYVQLTRLMETVKEPPQLKQDEGHKGLVRIMERSLQNNRYCFTELARREGKLQEPEFVVLSEWHNWLEEKFDLNLDVIVYLRTSPETVYGRMQNRARKEESSVPIDYLKSLHETYEDWLIRGKIDEKYSGVSSEGSSQEELSSTDDIKNIPPPKVKGNPDQKIIVVDANQGKEQVAAECINFLRAYMTELGCEVDEEGNNISENEHEKKHNGIH